MAILALIVMIGALPGAWLAGSALARTDRSLKLVALACVLYVPLWFYLHDLSDTALWLVPWDDYVFFERIPLYFAILLLLALCWWRLERRRRLALGFLTGLFALFTLGEVGGPVAFPVVAGQLDSATMGPPRQSTEVFQSTGWSCGAAALAWALRLKGFPASERQMAELAASTPLRGTKTRGLLRAAHRLGLSAHAYQHAVWEQLLAAPKPVVVDWRLSATLGHMVVLIAIEGDQVTVGDPLQGESGYSKTEFMAHWMHGMLVLE